MTDEVWCSLTDFTITLVWKMTFIVTWPQECSWICLVLMDTSCHIFWNLLENMPCMIFLHVVLFC